METCQHVFLSLSTARQNFKTSDLLFIMGKLDFFPSLIVKSSLSMSVSGCEFSRLRTEEVDIISVMLQRMMQDSHKPLSIVTSLQHGASLEVFQ